MSFPEQVRFAGAEPVVRRRPRATTASAIHAEPILAAITAAHPRRHPQLAVQPDRRGDRRRRICARSSRAAAARGVLVISDETYERFVYDGRAHASAAALAARLPGDGRAGGLVLQDLRHDRLAARLRCSGRTTVIDAAGDDPEPRHLERRPRSPWSGALAALRDAEPEVERDDRGVPRRGATCWSRGSTRCPASTAAPPAGAFYAFPDVAALLPRRAAPGSIAFAEFLLEEARVAVVPGAAFGADDHIRLSFACSRETLAAGSTASARRGRELSRRLLKR